MKKKLALALVVVLAFALGVGGTFAYLTSQATVTNTFTVGSVAITLDELDVDNDSNTNDNVTMADGTVRDTANSYKLIPGQPYTKDPIIHVDPNSETCYVFVKVENGIAAYEATDASYTNIADQITANGWTALNGVANVYYKEYTKDQDDKDLEVFANFKIADNANTVAGWNNISAQNTTIVVTGYAVQSAGFSSAADAWTTNFAA